MTTDSSERVQRSRETSRAKAASVRRLIWVALAALVACNTIPPDRYGVERIRLHGVESIDPYALRACLATTARDRVTLNFGRSREPECNVPPFTPTTRPRIPFWKKSWPLFDRNVFERDLQRVRRFYRARGFYDATVTTATYDPAESARDDRVSEDSDCERNGEDEGCALNLDITVEEGEPVLIGSIIITGTDAPELRESLEQAWAVDRGERFDEVFYERSKENMLRVLRNEGYACGAVSGHVEVDREAHRADIHYHVDTGPKAHLREIALSGEQDLRRVTILAVADLHPGDEFSDSSLEAARHAVYALGAFASVDILTTNERDESEACTGAVDVSIRVSPGRRLRYGLGGGLQSGLVGSGLQQEDVLQWDIHLLGYVEHRNFLGGLRRMRLEYRPKLIFSNLFPRPVSSDGDPPRLGNEIRMEFRQPAFIEGRTTLVVGARYDYGPDPLDAFFRHNLDTAIGVRRNFFDGRLSTAFGIHFNLFIANDDPEKVTQGDYRLIFLEQSIQLDLRDDTRSPRLGIYAGIDLQQAALLSWDYLRIVPDFRAYVPLGPLVLAGRFRLGWMKIFRADEDLDDVSTQLGPQPYRLRSGGASSHRGFVAGFLGDPVVPVNLGDPDSDLFLINSGGLRRWEASLELRIPVNEDFGLVAFGDVGDVNRGTRFRFSHVRLAVGLGLRYRTIIGPFRLDVGWLVPGAQIIGQDDPRPSHAVNLGFARFQGAVHLTIGEAF